MNYSVSYRLLPYRQLRNVRVFPSRAVIGLLPYRQLRKYATVRTFGINGLLPYRQLRNNKQDMQGETVQSSAV